MKEQIKVCMIIQNMSNGKLVIKHSTLIDPDNEFGLDCNTPEELLLFDKFFKEKLEKNVIAVQVFEIVDRKTSLSDYFAEQSIWDNTPAWNEWFKDFKANHTLELYFYDPILRQKVILHGDLDASYELMPKFNSTADCHESFEIKDYFINELDSSSTVNIHINTNVIYDCLKNSNVMTCKNLIKEFNYELLQKDLMPNPERKNNKPKL